MQAVIVWWPTKASVLNWLAGSLVWIAVLVGGISPALGQTIYETENATLSGPSVASANGGYSGTGYADYNNASADYVEFSLNAGSTGTYPIAFRYANGGTGDRPLQLSVNGVVVVSSLSFPVTGGWATWAFTATNNVTLNAGLNTVRITATGSSGANVDYMLVTVNGTTSPVGSATNAPLRRPVSPNQPMLLVHIDTWNYADPQKIIDLVPADIRPFVVMNISLSINHDGTTGQWLTCQYGYETAKSWLRACAENGMWATIQPSSGGFSQLPDSDLSLFEEFYRDYPNFIGFNYAEQFWGFDSTTDPLSWPWTTRVAHWVDLMKLNQKYGGYLIVSWCGNQWDSNINPIGMLKRNPAFAAICKQSPKNFIVEEKYTQQSYQSAMESVFLGTYLSGYAGQYGIRYDETGWTDGNGSHTNFTMASAGAPLLEHVMLTGETVIDGPELIWAECIQGLSNGTTADGYTTRRWGLFSQYQNNILDLFRKILDGTVRIPSRQEVINRTKVVIIDDVNSGSADTIYSSPQTLFEGLYRMDGDGNNQYNLNFMKKTGRYPTVPTVYQLADSIANSFAVKVNNSAYSTRWPTLAAKTNEFNSLFPSEYTGNLYAGRYENGWVTYNPFKTTLTNGQMASASIPFKYNTCDHMDLTYSQYTAGVIKEYSNSVTFYLGNYDNFINLGMRTDTITIYGSSSQPTYSWADRASHTASTVTSSWVDGVFSLNVTHNGALDITVNCAGTATGRLTSYTPATVVPPVRPPVYLGAHQYEAENFDYKNINGNVTQGVNTGVSNYTAMGYLRFGTSSSASIRDTVTVLAGGTYRLETKYAVTGANVSTIDLYVNGSRVATPAFTQTASYNDWAIDKQFINLNAGANTIEFRANATGASSVYFDNIVVVPTAIAGDGIIIQENSKGFTGVDGTVDNTYSGYTGNGYASPSDSYGAGIDWNIYFDSSVTKSLTFRYASTNNSTADLIVDDTTVASNIQFPSTGAWTNWGYVTVYPSVTAGASDVRLQSTTNTGLPNIDYIQVVGGGAETTLPTPSMEPVADASVRDGSYADSNFGTQTNLDVTGSSSSGLSERSYLQFDVHALANPQSVKLKLTPYQADGAASLLCEAVSDNWTETGITWNNQPGSGTAITNVSGYVAGQTIEIDVTAAAKSAAAGGGFLSLRVTEPGSAGLFVGFASRESSNVDSQPVLEYLMSDAPGIPTNLVAATANSYQAALSWTASTGAVGYNVKRSTLSGGPYTVIARNVSGKVYSDTSLSAGATYYYVVTSVNNIGESDASNEASVTTLPPPRLEPVADSYVESSNPTVNYGTSTNLLVKNNVTLATRITYLLFDVHALSNVQSATVTLMPNRADDTTVKMYYEVASTNWTEAGITWNSQPGGTGVFLATNTVTAGVPVSLDVTSAVARQATNGGLLSLRITQPTNSLNGLIQFCSREYGITNWRPVLTYTLRANTAPALAAIANRTIGAGMMLYLTNSATDVDVPAQTLTYSLLTAPANAALDSSSGVLTWRPLVTQANRTFPFTVIVADNGTPSLSATQSFTVTVIPLAQPQMSAVAMGGSQLALQVNGDSGPDYQIQASTNLVDWSTVFTTNSPVMPFVWTYSTASPMNFFRVQVGPPF